MIRTDPLLKIAAIMTNYCASHALARCRKAAPAPHARGETAPRRGGAHAPKQKKGPSRPLRAEMPCMSGTAYPPTDCTAVLSAMGSLTAGFGMGPGDPPLHGSAHAGRSPARDAYPVFNPGATLGVAWRSANLVLTHIRSRR